METAQADCAMKTEYAICYCKDKAGKTAVAQVRRTLQEQSQRFCWIPATCTVAFPGQVAAVRPGELYRAPGFRRRKAL